MRSEYYNLRGHGMDDASLQSVFRSVVVAELQYVYYARLGFSTVANSAPIRRSACRS
jgi:hypothetical protein